ncbi:MAG: hypothetical protein HKN46_10710 [Acidimicrobiia bacterium]|nr:hypothetical protein [Acidimicrobiia bacterium]
MPDIVIDFILEHHGTQRIGFFYEKAREESDEPVDVSRFSYPGPKPQTRETAIVMLADSCESAARAMREPTPERVRDLIDMVVSGKLADGQLDETPLTLGEIARIKDQFVKILGGVVHRRIEYPETKHLTDAESDHDEGNGGDGDGGEGNGGEADGGEGEAAEQETDAALSSGHSYADTAPGRAARALDAGDGDVPGRDGPSE